MPFAWTFLLRYNGRMLSNLFHTFIYGPLYNALVLLVDIVPFADVGLVVIILTLIVKLFLFPLSIKAVRTQLAVRRMESEIATLKEKYKNNKEEHARQTMALYRKNGVNPFSSFLLILIQFPIILGLYWVFARGGLPVINLEILYPFTPIPEVFNMQFLWVSDIAGKSIILALLAGITQFFQIRLTLPPLKKKGGKPSLKEDLTHSFHLQMRYVMPVVVVGVAYMVSAAIAIYWTTSNLFAIGQEFYVRRRIKNQQDVGFEKNISNTTIVQKT